MSVAQGSGLILSASLKHEEIPCFSSEQGAKLLQANQVIKLSEKPQITIRRNTDGAVKSFVVSQEMIDWIHSTTPQIAD